MKAAEHPAEISLKCLQFNQLGAHLILNYNPKAQKIINLRVGILKS
jgi:hypothetical protein